MAQGIRRRVGDRGEMNRDTTSDRPENAKGSHARLAGGLRMLAALPDRPHLFIRRRWRTARPRSASRTDAVPELRRQPMRRGAPRTRRCRRLFKAPFDFATLDWMGLDVGKAVNVIKQADITGFRASGARFFCMADGTIKQINACADPSLPQTIRHTLDRFAHMARDLHGYRRGAGRAGLRDFRPKIAALKQAEANGETPAPIDEYFMLGYARSGFLTMDKGGLCFVITQAITPEMQKPARRPVTPMGRQARIVAFSMAIPDR